MRIAWILPGGVDRSRTHRVIPAVLWLLERLSRVAEVHVFALRQEATSAHYELLGATVHAVGSPGRGIRALKDVWTRHRQARFDVVYATGGVGADVVASAAGRLLGVPVVMHLTGGEVVAIPEAGYGGRLSLRGRGWVAGSLRAASRVLALSDPIREMAEALGHPSLRVPLGVDRRAWPPREPRLRRRGEAARLLHVASLNRVKDPSTLLEAMGLLEKRGVDFRLDVVGEDTLGGSVQRRTRDLGLATRVEFHGFLTNLEVRKLAESAHLLLVSSRHEAGPVVALEAAAVGVPTVGTDVGHLSEWAGDAAVTVPVADPTALARATTELLEDDARRVRLAHLAQARALHEDADRTADRVLGVFDEVIEMSRNRR